MKHEIERIIKQMRSAQEKLLEFVCTQKCEFATEAEYNDLYNELYDLPCLLIAGKYGGIRAVVLRVEANGKLIVGYMYEDYGTIDEYWARNLSADELTELADSIIRANTIK